MFTLFKKELDYYLNNAVGYIVVILFAVFVNFLYVKDIFLNGSVSMKSFFGIIPWLFLIFIPAITMRAFSEEKRLNTIELLLTLPVSEAQIVIAKFFTYIVLVMLALLLTFSLPASFYYLAHIYLPEVIVGYAGAVLMGASFIAIAMYFSTLTKNQIVSFLSSLLVLFVLLGISSDLLSTLLPKFIQDMLVYFSPIYHFQNFAKGIVDLRSVYYFVSIAVLFLFLTVVNLEKRD
ncbi:ABC transporter permease subunit [Candidatus Roizmanbacteria bacterium]|nr:ABC transporter permease subunit [Candidatus Roizmanbacteria bacterium]